MKFKTILICLFCYALSYQRTEMSLDEIEETLHTYITKANIDSIGFDLSDAVYIVLDNIKVFYKAENILLNKVDNTIDYFDMDVFFLFDMIIHNVPLKEFRDYYGTKNITFTSKGNIGNIFYSNFQFYQLNDKGFEFKDFVEPSYVSITLSELNDFDLYYDSLKDFGERKIKDLLFLKWYQTLNNILSIFPVCDSFYYYNKLVEYLRKKGEITLQYPEYPSFKTIVFHEITYKSILKINRYAEKLTLVTFDIDFYNGASYRKKVYFEYIKVTAISIDFGPLYPDNIELQQVMTRYIKESFAFILKSNDI